MASSNPAISNANLLEKVRNLEAKATEQTKELTASLHTLVNERFTEIDTSLQETENDIEALREELETTMKKLDRSKEDAWNALSKEAAQFMQEIKNFAETYSIELVPVGVPPSALAAEQSGIPIDEQLPQPPEVDQLTENESSRSRRKCKNDKKRITRSAANRGGTPAARNDAAKGK